MSVKMLFNQFERYCMIKYPKSLTGGRLLIKFYFLKFIREMFGNYVFCCIFEVLKQSKNSYEKGNKRRVS